MTGNPLSQFPAFCSPQITRSKRGKRTRSGKGRDRIQAGVGQEELVEAEVESFIVIPSRGVIHQLKCLLSVPLKVSNNKSQG